MEYNFSKENIVALLSESDPQKIKRLYEDAFRTKVEHVGNKVYLRGLVEITNICRKNCLYCGIRKENQNNDRYEIDSDDVIAAAKFAYQQGYGSMVIQGGERNDKKFITKITSILKQIREIDPESPLGITLSLGEQSLEVYQEWFEAGAHRYLLRIESSTQELFEKIHPVDETHSFQTRLNALKDLRRAGFQVGTGVMIGLPFQTLEHLADDLLFFKSFDIDMCGMGPYLEHSQTPLFQYKDILIDKYARLELSLKMVAILRLMMPDINIAATTAMQSIDPSGREKAILAGANVIMPNLTLTQVRSEYSIYENKPGVGEDAAITSSSLEKMLNDAGIPIGYNEWGDSRHFKNRK